MTFSPNQQRLLVCQRPNSHDLDEGKWAEWRLFQRKKNNVHWKKLSSNILHLHYHLFEVFFYNCHCWSKWFHLNLSFHSIAILLAAVHSFVFTCVIQWCFQNHQCNVMMIMTMFIIRMNHDMRDDMVYNGGRTKTGRRTIRIGRCIVFPEPNRSSAQKKIQLANYIVISDAIFKLYFYCRAKWSKNWCIVEQWKRIWLPWEIAWQFFTSQLNDDLNALLQIKIIWITATYNRYPSALAKAQWAAVKI